MVAITITHRQEVLKTLKDQTISKIIYMVFFNMLYMLSKKYMGLFYEKIKLGYCL